MLLAKSLVFLYRNFEENVFIKILNKMKFPKNWEEILEMKGNFQSMIKK